jgi:hypothetical protein
VWILGSLVTLVVAVILTVTLPLAGAQTAPVGTAELIGATGRVLWGEKGQLGWCPSKVQAPPTTVPGSPHSGDSSEPSAQSRSWSHTKCLGMHWRFWHMNSRSSQVLLYTGDKGGGPLSPVPSPVFAPPSPDCAPPKRPRVGVVKWAEHWVGSLNT